MKKRAFTLFELLVSISIIAILIAVASTSYGSAQKKARDARRAEDLNSIQKAMEQYYASNTYQYPTDRNSLVPNYIQSLPTDPKGYAYTYGLTLSTYCVGAGLDTPTGNCTSAACAGFGTTTGAYYCVKNQQ